MKRIFSLQALAVVAGLLGSDAGWASKLIPTGIIQCPSSAELRRVPGTVHIGITHYDVMEWSDGYRGSSTSPDVPSITRCTDDGPIFWVASAKVQAWIHHGFPPPASAPQGWYQLPAVRLLKPREYLEAIAQGLGDSSNRLRYLRLQAWRAANHARRAEGRSSLPIATSDFPPGSPERTNLEALIYMLDENNAVELLTKAEALRQLARFDEAQALLDQPMLAESPLRTRGRFIAERVRLRDAVVVLLPETR